MGSDPVGDARDRQGGVVSEDVAGHAVDERDHETILQEQTYAFLREKSQLNKEKEFLRHYMQMAQHHHEDNHHRARAMFVALDSENQKVLRLQEELRVAKTDLAVEVTACRQFESIYARRDAALTKLEKGLRARIDELRGELAIEEERVRAASDAAAVLQHQLQEAKNAHDAELHVSRSCKQSSEKAEEAHAEVASEAAERDEQAAVALQQALNKLENDFAKERAVHETRGRTHEARVKELERILQTEVPPPVGHDPGRGSMTNFVQRVAQNAALAPASPIGHGAGEPSADGRPRPAPLESGFPSPGTSVHASRVASPSAGGGGGSQPAFFGLPVSSTGNTQLLPPEAAAIPKQSASRPGSVSAKSGAPQPGQLTLPPSATPSQCGRPPVAVPQAHAAQLPMPAHASQCAAAQLPMQLPIAHRA